MIGIRERPPITGHLAEILSQGQPIQLSVNRYLPKSVKRHLISLQKCDTIYLFQDSNEY